MALLAKMFDPEVEGSYLWRLKDQVKKDHEALMTGLKIQEATAAEAARGTRQGLDFQEDVFGLVEAAADAFGDRVEAVWSKAGSNGGKVGDIVCQLDAGDTGGAEQRIVIEVKDTPITSVGKGSFYKELDTAMANRNAHLAIGVIESDHAGPAAPFQYVAPNYILVSVVKDATTSLELQVAYRFARALLQSRAVRREARLDMEAFQGGLDAIGSKLQGLRAMRTTLTVSSKALTRVNEELKEFEDQVLADLSELEEQLNKVGGASGAEAQ
jgi:hypothetical protein